MRARASSEPRGVERARRRWVAARSVSGVERRAREVLENGGCRR